MICNIYFVTANDSFVFGQLFGLFFDFFFFNVGKYDITTSLGKNCSIGPNSYIGPYTSIGDNTEVIGGEIESSIIIGDCKISFNRKIVNSLIGRHSKIIDESRLPKGHKLILGEHSEVIL